MSNVNDIDKSINPLNETTQIDFSPSVFSTEIKSKKSQKIVSEKIQNEYSFEYSLAKSDSKKKSNFNRTINYENESAYNQSTVYSEEDIEPLHEMGNLENECNISMRYLEKHEKPCLTPKDYQIWDNSADEKTPFKETNSVQPNTKDYSHFRRLSNTMNATAFPICQKPSNNKTLHNEDESYHQEKDYCIRNSATYNQDDVSNENNDTMYLLDRVNALDMDDTTLSGLDELIGDLTLSKSIDLTKLAVRMRPSDTKEIKDGHIDVVDNVAMAENVTLLSNRSYLLWIGVPVQIGEIKSFTLNMRSSVTHQVDIKIKGSSSCFYLTNQHGQDRLTNVNHTFEPKTDKKFYVAFHPTNSDYHSDTIVFSVGNRRFKIKLYGYAEPAIVELKQFHVIDDPFHAGKVSLTKSCFKSIGKNKFQVSVYNSGARTAFVGLYSHQRDITFNPRVFLLIPKTKMEFDITVNVTTEMKLTSFFVISVDEELRRAARLNCSELPPSDSYNIFNNLQIFSRIPEETTIRQDHLPKYDWRPYLCRQINTSYRICYLNFDGKDRPSSTVDRGACDSVSTIGMLSKSSMTGRSALSNVECLNSKSVYVNSVCFGQSLQQALPAVVIFKKVNTFTPTCVTQNNYLGILIRNHNSFPIEWRVSDMTPVIHDTHDGLLSRSVIRQSSPDVSSVYSLTSIPIYDQSESMLIVRKQGTLQALESVVVPVRFSPQNTGKTECRCNVKVLSMNDDTTTSEKVLTFVGTAIRPTRAETGRDGGHPDIPGLVLPHLLERSVRLEDVVRQKFPVQVTLKNKSPHSLQLFTSGLARPFELKINSLVIGQKASLLKINFSPTETGTYRDVLVFCDEDGNSTFLNLVLRVT